MAECRTTEQTYFIFLLQDGTSPRSTSDNEEDDKPFFKKRDKKIPKFYSEQVCVNKYVSQVCSFLLPLSACCLQSVDVSFRTWRHFKDDCHLCITHHHFYQLSNQIQESVRLYLF